MRQTTPIGPLSCNTQCSFNVVYLQPYGSCLTFLQGLAHISANRMIPFLPVALQALLSGVLWKESTSPSLTFRLRHTHAIFNGSRNLFSDLPATLIADTDAYSLQTRLTTVHKPSSWQNYMDSRFLPVSESSLWQQSSIPGPDVEKRETLLQLAKMTFNTYYEPNSTQWYDLGPDWNTVRAVLCRSICQSAHRFNRPSLMDGSLTPMDFEDTSLSRRTNLQSWCLSKGHLSRGWEAGRRWSRTS